MHAYVLDWLALVVRWFHLTAGIAWIGASFYFIWLDDHLNRRVGDADRTCGMYGDLWAVHGGGFYHNQKYLTGPVGEPLSDELHWFYWEAYATWLSGFLMLVLVYWAGASTLLIDPAVRNLTPAAAIAISAGALVAGWLVYDALCHIFEQRPLLLWTSILLLLLAADWGVFQLFGARAAFLHVGAIIGTIMVANVLFAIIPGQRRVVAAIRAGRPPDPRDGAIGKTRSVHNTYFTLPVLFIMISNHYPMTYAGPNGWLVLAFIALAGVLVRRFFILTHAQRYVVGLPIAAAFVLAGVAFALAPRAPSVATQGAARTTFATVAPIVAARCAPCHTEHPSFAGFTSPPAGVRLDAPARIVAEAPRIRAQAVASHAMPLGNLTHITDAERARLGAWIDAGAPGPTTP